MIQIIPAILATTEDEFKEGIEKINSSELLEDGWVQIDLMDGKFVQNQSIRPAVIKKYKTPLKIEAQLMVEHPGAWIDDLVEAGVARIVFPIEDAESIGDTIKYIKNHGIQVGLSINPETPIEKIEPWMGMLDVVLVMSVHPGFQGGGFLDESIKRVERVSQLRKDCDFKIEVDGGINEDNMKLLIDAGTDNLVIGSRLMKGSLDENLERFWEAIKQ